MMKQHGMSRSEEYRIWYGMIQRCTNPNNDGYEKYGGKGIKVYEKWIESFEEFYNCVGKRPSKRHSIDRINGCGDYEPGNVRWATHEEQNRNKGRTKRNKTGVRGVSRYGKNKWKSQITSERKQIHLGYFDTLEEAKHARLEAERKYWKLSN